MINPMFTLVYPEVCVNSVTINIMVQLGIIPGTFHSIISYPNWVRKIIYIIVQVNLLHAPLL